MRNEGIRKDESREGILNLEEWIGIEGLWSLGPGELWDMVGPEGALELVWHQAQGLAHRQRSLWNN